MDFTIPQPDFARALRLVGRAASTKPKVPILQAVLIEAVPDRLSLTAADLEIGVTTAVPAEVRTPGRVAIPARLLVEYVAQLPAEPVCLTFDGDRKRVQARCGSFAASIATLDAAGFPSFPHADEGEMVSLSAGDLRLAIDRVAFAVARDDSRPVLSAVLFDFGPEGLTLAAADGFRLARARIPQTGGPTRQLLVPARALVEFSRMLAGADSAHLTAAVEGRLMHLAVKDSVLFTHLIDGRFPDVERVIPQSWATRVKVETAPFRQAVRATGLFGASGDARPVLLEATPGLIRMQARGDETGEARSEVTAVVEGAPQVVVLNTRLLADLLDALTGSQLELAWSGPQTPVVVREVESASPADLWLLMPLHEPALTRSRAEAA